MSSEQEETKTYQTWEALVAAAVSDDMRGWVFRGTSNYAYAPLSKLERVLQNSGFPKGQWRALEDKSLGFFKEHARAFLENPPADDDLIAWLSLMQHYGAPTRLTDWTFSPFVAIYFAYESVASDEGDAALWMLNAAACRKLIGSSYPFERDHFGVSTATLTEDGVEKKSYPFRDVTDEVIERKENDLLRYFVEGEYAWPLPLVILRPDRRMTAQQACFVTSGRLSETGQPTTKEMFINRDHLKKALEELAAPPRPGTWIEPIYLYISVDEETGEESFINPYHIPTNLSTRQKPKTSVEV